MINNANFDFCSKCDRKKAHSDLVTVGEKIFVTGNSCTNYTFYQCKICGHLWQHIEESGFGGHGSNYSILTKP